MPMGFGSVTLVAMIPLIAMVGGCPEAATADVDAASHMDLVGSGLTDLTGGLADMSGLGAAFTLTFKSADLAQFHGGEELYYRLKEGTTLVGTLQHLPIPASGPTTFTIPNVLASGHNYSLQFWSDRNSNGTCEAAPNDHTWARRVPSTGLVTGDVTVTFPHSTSVSPGDDICP